MDNPTDTPAYRAARRRVMRRLIMQITFVGDALFFAVVMLAILTSRKSETDGVIGGLVWMVFWGTILFVHAMYAFNLFRGRIDRAVQRELQREALNEKPKRQQVGLSDDGELVEIAEEAPLTRRSGGESRPQ